jgi:hypothetical protein
MNRCIPTYIMPCVLLLVVCCGRENGDAAKTIDSGAVDGGTPDVNTTKEYDPAYQPAVLQGGQMELPLPTGRYRVGLSERLMTPGGEAPNEPDTPIPVYTPYYTRIFFPVDPTYTGETLTINHMFIPCSTSDQVLTHTYLHADIVPGENRFPVVLFAPGAGVPIDQYVSILEDLASHGYIVVAFQPESGFPSISSSVTGPSLPVACASEEEWTAYYEFIGTLNQEAFDSASSFVGLWVAQAVHVLDHIEQLDQQDPAGILTGRLDLEKVGMFGHSIGGATAREACMTDPRFKACENLDGSFYGEHFDSPLASPLMIQLTGDHSNLKSYTPQVGYVDLIDTTIQTVWDVTTDAFAYRIAIRDIVHMSFLDSNPIDKHFVWNDAPAGDDACVSLAIEYLVKQCITKENKITSAYGTLDPVRAIDISRAYTRAFFDKHLKGIDQALLKGPSAAYPEVTFEAKHPQ